MKNILFLITIIFALPSMAEDVAPVHQAAIHGNAGAQFQMCGLYYMGHKGVPKNLIEAANWCLLAAQQGHTEAQYNLALMYQNGEGVGQNISEATKWYRDAAAKGHRLAQYNLAQIAYANNQRNKQKENAERKDSENRPTALLIPPRPSNSGAQLLPAPTAPAASRPLPPTAPQIAAPAKLTQKEILCRQAANKGIIADNCIAKPTTGGHEEDSLPIETITANANSGNTEAMLKLASLYNKTDKEKSFAWYNLAADRLPEGGLKNKALANVKALSLQLNNDQISHALNFTTELDRKIPLPRN